MQPVMREVEGSGPSTRSTPSTVGPPSVEDAGLRLGPGRLVAGRYRVVALLGGGRASRVYTATDEVLDRPVALKVFAAAAGPGGGPAVDAMREARVLARLGHPNLVELYDAGLDDGLGWVVLRLVPGGTLVGPAGVPVRRSPAEVARIGSEVADALDHAHGHGLVHRDVTPANVLVDDDGHVVLGDFGIARAVDAARTTAAGVVVGTPGYLSPEQVSGGHVTGASDVYSLGLVLVECLTGEREYDGTGVEAALARLTRPPRIPRGLPPALAGVLSAMTAADPAARPTAAEVRDRLAALARPVPASAATLTQSTAPLPFRAAPGTRALTLTRLLPVRPRPPEPAEGRDGDRSPSAVPALAAAALAVVLVVVGLSSSDRDPTRSPTSAGSRPSDAPSAVLARATTAPTPHPTAWATPRPATQQGDEGDQPGDGNGNGDGHGHQKHQG